MKTFAQVNKDNPRNIRKALAGLVFVKPWRKDDDPITQVWTESGGLMIPDTYKNVGVVDKNTAIKLAADTQTADVESWGYGEPTRRDITSDTTSVSFVAQESHKAVFELYNGVDLSAVRADAQKNIVVDKPLSPVPRDWRLLVLSKDGDGPNAIYWLDIFPRAQVTAKEDIENSAARERAYGITMTGQNDPAWKTSHRLIWGGPGIDIEAMGFTTG